MSIVIGIDAGFAACGLVAVDLETAKVLDWTTIHTARTAKKRGVRVADDDAERCAEIAHAVRLFAADSAGAVVELPSGGAQGARASRSMGMATGVVVASLDALGLPAEWVTPQAVKKAATGRNDGSKEAVEAAVFERFEWTSKPTKRKDIEHACDAAAAVLAAWDGTLLRALRRVGAAS